MHRSSRPRYTGRCTDTVRGPCLHLFTPTLAHLRCSHVATHVQQPARTRLFQYVFFNKTCLFSLRSHTIKKATTLAGTYIVVAAPASDVDHAYKHLPPHKLTSSWFTWPPTSKNHPEHVFFNIVTHYQGSHRPFRLRYIGRHTGTSCGLCPQRFTTPLAHLLWLAIFLYASRPTK